MVLLNIEHLKIARKNSGMTQKEVADHLGIVQSAYKNYEQGNREPKGDTVVMLADLFNVTTDYLLGRDTGEPETIDMLAGEFNMSELEKKLLDNYLSLPKNMRSDLMEFLEKSVNEIMEENN